MSRTRLIGVALVTYRVDHQGRTDGQIAGQTDKTNPRIHDKSLKVSFSPHRTVYKQIKEISLLQDLWFESWLLQQLLL